VTTSDSEAPPIRGEQHDALAVFLGRWRAEGTSYGSPEQSANDPKRGGEPWSAWVSQQCSRATVSEQARSTTAISQPKRI
jgi:hypothetical protein